MATYTYLASTSVLPKSFSYAANIADLFDLASAQTTGTPTSSQWDIKDKNGLVLSFTGSGFARDAGDEFPSAGTVTAITLKSGTTEVAKITGIDVRAFALAEGLVGTGNFWDVLTAALSGNDTVQGGAGDDDLWGAAGDDTITGGVGNDDLSGGDGSDNLNGGEGDDYLIGGDGVDAIDGGAGTGDMLSFIDAEFGKTAFSGIDLDASRGTVIDNYHNSETFQNIEQFRGSIFGDKMKGSDEADMFQDMGGRDTIDGGNGFDEISYYNDAGFGGRRGVTVDLSTGYAIDGFGFKDSLSNIENVDGTDNNDKITGDGQDNDLYGNGGNDTIVGGAGNDWISGFTGNDTLTGGTGSDTFAFGGGLKKNVDTITDFVVADDQIALSKAIFSKFAQVEAVASGNFVIGTKAKDKNDHLIYDSKSGKLFYDADGSGKAAAVQIAQLDKNLKMTFADFELF
jgi:Ca2+-binding RTX toxin-like protein